MSINPNDRPEPDGSTPQSGLGNTAPRSGEVVSKVNGRSRQYTIWIGIVTPSSSEATACIQNHASPTAALPMRKFGTRPMALKLPPQPQGYRKGASGIVTSS